MTGKYHSTGHKVQNGDFGKNFDLLVSNWFSLMDRYSQIGNYRTQHEIFKGHAKNTVEDVPYWYNERATLSSFVGAVWCSGGVCLEEFHWEKDNESKNSLGRIDLYFTIPAGLDNLEFSCEAKQSFLSLYNKEFQNNAKRSLDMAVTDAQKLIEPNGDRLGVSFVTPFVHLSNISDFEKLDTQEKALEKVLDNIISFKADLTAWYFPCELRAVKSNDGRIFPGTFLLINRVK